MKKNIPLFFAFVWILLGVWVGPVCGQVQDEGDSFWEEEFFQEAPKTRLEIATEMAEEQKWDAAREEFQKIIENPENKTEYEQALLGLAQLYDDKGDVSRAVRYYKTLSRKTEDEALIQKAEKRIVYYEDFILNQFHLGDWYPKLWFHQKTNAFAKKYPKYEWLFKHGSFPVLLVLYKLVLLCLFLIAVVLFTRKKGIEGSFTIRWGLPSVFWIYLFFLFFQLYLVFLLKPTGSINETRSIAFDVISILGYLTLTAAILLFLTLKGIQWRRLGIGLDKVGHHLVLTLKYSVVIVILFGIYAFLRFNGFIEQDKIIHSYPISSLGSALYFFQFVLIVMIAPISEEIFYRGFMYPVVRNRVGVLAGIILVSLFFAMVHVQSTFILFFVSFFLCFIYEKNRSLIPSILVHAFYNLLVRFGGGLLPGQ